MRALITGITGQDGPYLAQHLLSLGYEVIGTYRREATGRFDGLDYLKIRDKVRLVPIELTEYESVAQVIKAEWPDHIYNLAAQSHVGFSFSCPLSTLAASGIGVVNLLEAIRNNFPEDSRPRIYQASTSELFGGNLGRDQIFNEDTPFHPRSPYACAKLYAHAMIVNYREAYGIHACNGILFNHESPLRGPNFVTRKVTMKVAEIVTAISRGLPFTPLEIGNIKSSRDWGFAGDYVKAMHLMLAHDKPGDYVIASGTNHTVADLISYAFGVTGYKGEWRGEDESAEFWISHYNKPFKVVAINPDFYRPSDCTNLTGDYSKAHRELGWKPETDFYHLVEMMVRYDWEVIQNNATWLK